MLKIKLKKKVVLLLCLIFTYCLFVPCFSGCKKIGPSFIDFRANWVYEGEDMTLIITTHGDSQYNYNGKIIVNEKERDIFISVAPHFGQLAVYINDGIDTKDNNWPQEDLFLFSCSYDGYKNWVTLSHFVTKAPDGSDVYDDEKKIVLTRHDY